MKDIIINSSNRRFGYWDFRYKLWEYGYGNGYEDNRYGYGTVNVKAERGGDGHGNGYEDRYECKYGYRYGDGYGYGYGYGYGFGDGGGR